MRHLHLAVFGNRHAAEFLQHRAQVGSADTQETGRHTSVEQIADREAEIPIEEPDVLFGPVQRLDHRIITEDLPQRRQIVHGQWVKQ